MVGLVVNVILGIALMTFGSLTMKRHPSTKGFVDWVQERANYFAGGEFCVPFYVVAIVFILLGAFALFNAFTILGQYYGFWIV